MSSKTSISLFSVFSHAERTWEFFKKDNTLGTIMFILGGSLVKYYVAPDLTIITLIIALLLILGMVTGFKYHYDLEDRAMQLQETELNEQIITDRLTKLKQFEQIDEMLMMGYHTGHVLLREALDYVTDSEPIDRGILKMLIKSSEEAVKLIGDKLHLRTLPFKEYLKIYVGGLGDRISPALDQLPSPLAADQMIAHMKSVETVPIEKRSEEIDDFNPKTDET